MISDLMLHVQYVGMTLKQHLLYYHAISIIGSFMQLMKCLRHAKKMHANP